MSIYYNWENNINENELKNVCDVLKNNGIVIFPTETVYGIGGNALSIDVINKIYKAKERPKEKALTILVKNKFEISKYAEISNNIERKIIDKFMPGPITIILNKKKSSIAKNATSNNETIGIRIPDNKIIQKILNNCEFPIAAPSANISGKPSGTRMCDIIKDFEKKVDVLIDGGDCKNTISSTIVKVEGTDIIILREGAISKTEIENAIKD